MPRGTPRARAVALGVAVLVVTVGASLLLAGLLPGPRAPDPGTSPVAVGALPGTASPSGSEPTATVGRSLGPTLQPSATVGVSLQPEPEPTRPEDGAQGTGTSSATPTSSLGPSRTLVPGSSALVTSGPATVGPPLAPSPSPSPTTTITPATATPPPDSPSPSSPTTPPASATAPPSDAPSPSPPTEVPSPTGTAVATQTPSASESPPPPAPPAPPPVLYASGNLAIPQTFSADLDEGVLSSTEEADIFFHAVSATARYIEPVNGARMARLGAVPGGYVACREATFTTTRVDVNTLQLGAHVCVRTAEGRLSDFMLIEPIGPSPGTLLITFSTWETLPS